MRTNQINKIFPLQKQYKRNCEGQDSRWRCLASFLSRKGGTRCASGTFPDCNTQDRSMAEFLLCFAKSRKDDNRPHSLLTCFYPELCPKSYVRARTPVDIFRRWSNVVGSKHYGSPMQMLRFLWPRRKIQKMVEKNATTMIGKC